MDARVGRSNPAAKIAALIAGVAPACFTVARASATGSEAPFEERVELAAA